MIDDPIAEDHEPDALLGALTQRRLWLILAGIPAVYWINGFMPWSYGLFVQQDHRFFVPFMISICVLHWASLLVTVATVHRTGAGLEEIGVFWSPLRLLILIGIVVAAGIGWIVLRGTWPATETPQAWQLMYPWSMVERCFFVFVSLTAGICEEVVYRGFAIRALQARGMRTWKAVSLAALSFVLMHGLYGVFASPFLILGALVFSGLFLWRKSLAPGMYVHALFDVMSVAAV